MVALMLFCKPFSAHAATDAEMAKSFLDLLVLDPAEMAQSGLDQRPLLVKTAQLYHQTRYLEALDAYKIYLFDKLRRAKEYGLRPGQAPTALPEKFKIDDAAPFLDGSFVLRGIAIGNPGHVQVAEHEVGNVSGPRDDWNHDLFMPLFNAYLQTGESVYLNRWVAYMNDWIENGRGARVVDALNVADRQHYLYGASFWAALSRAANLQKEAESELPSLTLARTMQRLVLETIPANILYHRTNPQNWTPHACAAMTEFATLIDEFKVANTLFEEGIRRLENYTTLQNFPDGTETEHAPWYNKNWLRGITEMRNGFAVRSPSPLVPSWERAVYDSNRMAILQDAIDERVRFLVRFITADGELPLGMRNDRRGNQAWYDQAVRVVGESLFDEPNLRRIINTVNENWKNRYAAESEAPKNPPHYFSESFPYSGFYLLRRAWSRRADYAHLTTSPVPAGGHALVGLKSNNSLGLSAQGMDLLHPGAFGTYSYERSPIRVDGFEEYALAGVAHFDVPMAHKGFLVDNWGALPGPWRFHTSPAFDLAEGIYDGAYGFLIDDHHDQGFVTPQMVSEATAKAIKDVTHQRIVLGDRASGLWIVTDRLNSETEHAYHIDWRLPSLPHPNPDKVVQQVFTPEKVQIDAEKKRIRTDEAVRANLSIHQFSSMPLRYETEVETGENLKEDYTYRYRLYCFFHVSAGWTGKGSQQVISLLHPRHKDSAEILSINEVSTPTSDGFSAVLSGDRKLIYQSAKTGTDRFTIGGLTVQAEALLVSAEGEGVVMGCTQMTLDGRPIRLAHPDFEFKVSGNQLVQSEPIYRPILPVQIQPARTLLIPGEHITLSCETTNVEIRYTLDGSIPDITSPLYRAPLPFKNAMTVKARAFRPGLKETPVTSTYTHASETTRADYQAAAAIQPVQVATTEPGLTFTYAEGPWGQVGFFPEAEQPLKTGTVTELFDTSTRNPEAPYYAYTYQGYLDIPKAGIYTFHAPEEYLRPAIMAGYELTVELGQDTFGLPLLWKVCQERFALGTWSVHLEKGLHPFRVRYADLRWDYTTRFNAPGVTQVWDGDRPALLISGPGMEAQSIPADWLKQKR